MKAAPNIEFNVFSQSAGPDGVASTLVEPAISVALPALQAGMDNDLANELAIAHAIQQSLLPKEFPRLPGFGLAAFCQSARHIGGDFYDILPLGTGRTLLVIADVMGKGVPAALFAASFRMLVRTFVAQDSRPGELLKRINAQMFEELSGVDMFITAQFVVIDTERQWLQVASAGHCPLLLADTLEPARSITPDGLPLGINPSEDYLEQTAQLGPGACMLLYTDGLAEACNPSGTTFGHEGIRAWLTQNAGLARTAVQLKEELLQEFRRFQADTAAQDDVSLLIVAEEQTPAVTPVENTWIAQE